MMYVKSLALNLIYLREYGISLCFRTENTVVKKPSSLHTHTQTQTVKTTLSPPKKTASAEMKEYIVKEWWLIEENCKKELF